jgi:hypothetical protein
VLSCIGRVAGTRRHGVRLTVSLCAFVYVAADRRVTSGTLRRMVDGSPLLVLVHSPLLALGAGVGGARTRPARADGGRPVPREVTARPELSWRDACEMITASSQGAASVVLVGHSGAGALLPAMAESVARCTARSTAAATSRHERTGRLRTGGTFRAPGPRRPRRPREMPLSRCVGASRKARNRLRAGPPTKRLGLEPSTFCMASRPWSSVPTALSLHIDHIGASDAPPTVSGFLPFGWSSGTQ